MLGVFLMLLSLYFYIKGDVAISYFVIIFLITAGFQLLPLNWLITSGVNKTYDWAFPIFAFVLLFSYRDLYRLNLGMFLPYLKVCFLYILALFLYNLFFTNIETNSVLRIFRIFLLNVIFVPFLFLTKREYEKIFLLVILFTTVASSVYLVQTILGLPLLNNVFNDASAVGISDSSKLLRFYNVPVLVFPVLLLLMYLTSLPISRKVRVWCFILNLLALFAAQHRNLILILILSVIIGYSVKKQIRPTFVGLWIVSAFFVLNFLAEIIGGRFSEGLVDAASLLTKNFDVTTQFYLNAQEASTTEYRIFHFLERFRYVISTFPDSLIGIGFVTEDSSITSSLPFYIGLPNEVGEVMKVDTGDIFWSLIIVRSGLIGIILTVLFLISTFIRYFRNRRNEVSLIISLFFFQLIIGSFFGTDLTMAHTYAMIFLLVGCAQAANENTLKPHI